MSLAEFLNTLVAFFGLGLGLGAGVAAGTIFVLKQWGPR